MPSCLASPATCGAAPYNNSMALNIVQLLDGVDSVNGTSSSDPRCPLLLGPNLINAGSATGFVQGSPQAAAAALDFDLLPSSPALAMGFQPLPSAQWGPDWLPGGPGDGWRRVLFSAVPWAVGRGDGSRNTTLALLLQELRQGVRAAGERALHL